jgi:hypothetical protein
MRDAAKTPDELVAQANEALVSADWHAAKAAFGKALAQKVTPEALEGLATAAFFLDEAAVVLDARERAYAHYREAGRAVDAGRVAIALAWAWGAETRPGLGRSRVSGASVGVRRLPEVAFACLISVRRCLSGAGAGRALRPWRSGEGAGDSRAPTRAVDPRRQVSQPQLESRDRLLLAALSRVLPRRSWESFMVRPEALLRWHQRLVAGRWSYGPPLSGTSADQR